MPTAKRGDKIRNVITAKAWNKLHQTHKSQDPKEVNKSRFPNITVIGYDNNSTVLPRFSVVALNGPQFTPNTSLTDDNDPAYDTLEFTVSRALDASSSIGITQQPLGYNLDCKIVLYGVTWVRINITDPAANWADIDTNNRLKTTETGSIRILWKPTGLGVKQCLVVLGAAGKASTGSGGICYLNTALNARTTSPNRLGSALASKVLVDSAGNIIGYEPNPFTVWNTTKITQPQATLCQYKEISPGFRVLDVGDCSVLETGLVPVNPVPSAASACNNSLQLNPSVGISP